MKSTNVQPLADYVMLQYPEGENVSSGGIFIPDTAGGKTTEGIVVAKAAGATDEVAMGDRVIYGEYSGTEIAVDGVKYRMVPSGDLLAKYTESDEIPE